MDNDTALSWPISKLAQEATRVAIEGLGSSTFETAYGLFDQSLQTGGRSPWARVKTAACILIEATRKDSPGRDTIVASISLIWLAKHYPECLPLTANALINQMLPAYYDYRGQADRSKPHRGYLLYEPAGRAFQLTLTCTLYHMDEQTQVMVHGRDESVLHYVEQDGRVDRYRVLVQPGDRLQFTLHLADGSRQLEAWYTITTTGPVEEASHSSLWLVRLNQQQVPARLQKRSNP